MKNSNLTKARTEKNDEFYTRYTDIQYEINAYLEFDPNVFRGKTILLPCDDPEWSNFTKFFAQNFDVLGIKKLISTSFAIERKAEMYDHYHQLSLFETESEQYDEQKSKTRGKIFTLTRKGKKGRINIDDLEWHYLEGDGDFRSDEVRALRHEADFIITNPPFSLFREFIDWLFEEEKKFLIVGNKSCVTYKEIFPAIMENRFWSGATSWSGGMWFEVDSAESADKIVDGVNLRNVASTWFTNIDHGRRHEPLSLMTMSDNYKYSKHKQVRGIGYHQYVNHPLAINVPYTDAIPSDYDGIMGVPVSFLEKYCPEQFQILGCADANILPDGWGGATKEFVDLYYLQGNTGQYTPGNRLACYVDHEGNAQIPFKRVLIRKKDSL